MNFLIESIHSIAEQNLKFCQQASAKKALAWRKKMKRRNIVTNREREKQTLNFGKPEFRGTVAETFYPWDLTIARFLMEGMPKEIAKGIKDIEEDTIEEYLIATWGRGIMDYERYLSFDSVMRIPFMLPFRHREEKKVIQTAEDWKQLKDHARRELEHYYSDEQIEKAYRPLKEEHDKGDYSIRLNIEGFFWVPRELLGIEEHLYAFYDEPELLHDINAFVLEIYQTKLMKIIDILQPDVVYLMEDLSGKNGPMISGALIDEYMGTYYRQLIPMLKEHGVGNVFVDTDGDFAQVIPNFLKAGVDGFLPMDVNAGMDIVKTRRDFPNLKFIGGFNKLMIAKGPEAINEEFERILPVIRGGGYIPGSDHQVAPSTSLTNYKYYVKRLHEVMAQAGADL